MTLDRRVFITLAVASGLGSLMPAAGFAADPSISAIQRYGDRLIAAMKGSANMSVSARYNRLAPIMASAFDFGTMTKLIAGPSWKSISGGDQAALRQAFTRFISVYYASRIKGYSGEKFEVDPTPVGKGGQKIVKTKIISASGTRQNNYLMSGSRVIDIYYNGTVSEVAARRSEFAPILAKGGAPALIAALQTKSAALLAG